jgi:hypothetical protein
MFKKKRNKSNEIELVLLKSINNNYDLDIITTILDDNNIPYIIKEHGAGGYMRIIGGDTSLYRTDILVEKSTYEQAREIIDQITFE